jgi:hypothetical protein
MQFWHAFTWHPIQNSPNPMNDQSPILQPVSTDSSGFSRTSTTSAGLHHSMLSWFHPILPPYFESIMLLSSFVILSIRGTHAIIDSWSPNFGFRLHVKPDIFPFVVG